MEFSVKYTDIIARMEAIDPVAYGRSRNYMDGAVTRLSPYISRGVISTKMVMNHILDRFYPFQKVEKLIQELAWRDYWQQVWIAKGQDINEDLRQPQSDVLNYEMPKAIVKGNTGIIAIDRAIQSFYQDGYLHNHVRMYIASLACNIANSHWKTSAKWMYYHLLDGDWASNALSWQWVAGANANKKYFANQENINRYCHTAQTHTYLDIPYERFPEISIPDELVDTFIPELTTRLPSHAPVQLNPELPTLLYNYYNLDLLWHRDLKANRVLLLEPSVFEQYPIAEKVMNFMLGLADNIKDIQVFVGEFQELENLTKGSQIIYKEHPLNIHYQGTEDPRDWMFSVTGYFPSFFAFWKKCQKEIRNERSISPE